MPIIIVLVIIAIIVVYWLRRKPKSRLRLPRHLTEGPLLEPDVGDADFCVESGIDMRHVCVVDRFKTTFASKLGIERGLLTPQFEVSRLGFVYDDDLAMFLAQAGLLNNPDYHYSFPLEDATTFAELIKLTIAINAASGHE